MFSSLMEDNRELITFFFSCRISLAVAKSTWTRPILLAEFRPAAGNICCRRKEKETLFYLTSCPASIIYRPNSLSIRIIFAKQPKSSRINTARLGLLRHQFVLRCQPASQPAKSRIPTLTISNHEGDSVRERESLTRRTSSSDFRLFSYLVS